MEFVTTLKDDPVTIQFVDGYVDEVGEGYNSPVVLQVTSRNNPASHKSIADLPSKVVKGICNKTPYKVQGGFKNVFFLYKLKISNMKVLS